MSRILTAQDFVDHVGKKLSPNGRHPVLRLVSVETASWPGWESMARQPFTLILSGPPEDLLQEGLYDVAVEGGPDFALYIAPIHTVTFDRQDYQATFN
jgi:hypothetical protein